MPPLVELRQPRIEGGQLLARADDQRFGLSQLLLARLLLLELFAIALERARLALVLFLLGGEVLHQQADDLACRRPTGRAGGRKRG